MNDSFKYSWTSQSAVAYLNWLGSIQNRCNRRRRIFAWTAACILGAGLIFFCIVALASFPPLLMLISLGALLLSGVLMTDTCRGYPFFDPVGAVITDFNSMNEFDIGRFEKKALLGGQGEEIQKLLYCLRISANLPKYKKLDVILARWQTAMEHGHPYFGASPRGRLTVDFLTQIYFFYVHRALTDYATSQYVSISKLKTDAAKQRRLEKSKEKLVEILTQYREFPRMQDLINATYTAILKAAHA